MNVGGIVKNAPNSLIWAVALCFLGVLGAFVFLAATESSSEDLRAFLNTALNIASTLLAGGAFLAAGSAASSAGKVQEQQENGHMEETIRSGVERALSPQKRPGER